MYTLNSGPAPDAGSLVGMGGGSGVRWVVGEALMLYVSTLSDILSLFASIIVGLFSAKK